MANEPVAAFLFGGPRHRERIEVETNKAGVAPVKIVVSGPLDDLVYFRKNPVKVGYADYTFSHTVPPASPPEEKPKKPKWAPRIKISPNPPPPLTSRPAKRKNTDGTSLGLSCSCCEDGRPCEGLGI